jgi:hypothetical protein
MIKTHLTRLIHAILHKHDIFEHNTIKHDTIKYDIIDIVCHICAVS